MMTVSKVFTSPQKIVLNWALGRREELCLCSQYYKYISGVVTIAQWFKRVNIQSFKVDKNREEDGIRGGAPG